MKKACLISAVLAPAISLLSLSQMSHAEDLYGAELYSLDSVLYGKFVFRMKMVSEPGVVSSFFTYDNLSWQGDYYPWREIDFEAIGSETDLLQTNLITGDLYDKETSEQTAEVENLSQYHIFTLEWTPDSVVWKVDGVAVRTELAENSDQVVDLQGTPQTYRSNIWISEVEEWVGAIDTSQLPLYQVIDWIEYYSYVDEDEFEFEWRDDFTWFDTSRWAAGNWTFDTNRVTFDPDNLAVVNGELVFALTSGEPGVDVADYQGQ